MTAESYLDPNHVTPQRCKEAALTCLRNHAEFGRSRLEKRWSSDDRWHAAMLLDEAQVWATLATVPEPLEELTSTVELAAGDRIPELPNLVCPHRFVARLSSNVAHPGERPRLRYSFTDCESCP